MDKIKKKIYQGSILSVLIYIMLEEYLPKNLLDSFGLVISPLLGMYGQILFENIYLRLKKSSTEISEEK